MVISSRLPPSFCVTTGAAEAHGLMMHVRSASARMSRLPFREKAMTAAITTPTPNTWKAPSHQCHATGRRRRKSTLQNVTKSTRNMNMGSRVSNTGAALVANVSSCGTSANIMYTKHPVAMATGSVQSFSKRMSCILIRVL